MTYSAETWAIKKTQEMKMNVTEMKMLRLACGHTRMVKIKNNDIRNKMKVLEMHRKIQKKRLRWYGHIQRREEEFVTMRVLKMEVEGKRAGERPRRRWMECVKEDMAEKKLKTHDAADRPRWRTLTKNGNPT
jgi:hypothetical protein